MRVAITVAVAFATMLTGCGSPTEPTPPPGGGQEYVLDYDTFVSGVAPVLLQAGCKSLECHGGGIRGNYQLSPADASNLTYDYEQTILQVTSFDLDASPILTQPLAAEAGGEPHPHEPFRSPEDPGFLAIQAWVRSGESR